MINTLYSLTNTSFKKRDLEKVFNKRIRNIGTDTSKNTFLQSNTRLTNSLLKNIEVKDSINISALNPSVNDYVQKEIQSNTNEQIEIIKNAVYIEQLIKVATSIEAKKLVTEKLLTDELLKLESINNTVYYYYIKLILEYELYDVNIKEKVKIAFERIHENVLFFQKEEYCELICNFINTYSEYYQLNNIIFDPNKMRLLMRPMYLKYIDLIIGIITSQNEVIQLSDFLEMSTEVVLEKIKDKVYEKVDDELTDIVYENLSVDDRINIQQSSATYFLEQKLLALLEDIILKYLNEEIAALRNIKVLIKDIDIDDYKYYFDIDSAIESAMTEINDDYNEDDDWRHTVHSENDAIREIFER